MNPVPLFLIIVTLPLLLGGCGEKPVADVKPEEPVAETKPEEPVAETKPELEGVNYFELEERKGITYIKGSYSPYTGKAYKFYENGHKQVETNIKDGKRDGPETQWHENGQKREEINYKDGKWDGLWVVWYKNGQKKLEENYKNGKLVEGSAKYWNNKGEPVDSEEEAEK